MIWIKSEVPKDLLLFEYIYRYIHWHACSRKYANIYINNIYEMLISIVIEGNFTSIK
jgi:hypothetical protein